MTTRPPWDRIADIIDEASRRTTDIGMILGPAGTAGADQFRAHVKEGLTGSGVDLADEHQVYALVQGAMLGASIVGGGITGDVSAAQHLAVGAVTVLLDIVPDDVKP